MPLRVSVLLPMPCHKAAVSFMAALFILNVANSDSAVLFTLQHSGSAERVSECARRSWILVVVLGTIRNCTLSALSSACTLGEVKRFQRLH